MTVYYTVTGVPVANTRAASSPPRAEFVLIQTGFASVNADMLTKGAIAGQTWNGAHDFSAASSFKVPTPVNSTDAVTKSYADGLAFATALPGATRGLVQNDGTTTAFSKNIAFGLNCAKAADVASASAPDIWSGNGNTLHITGTTTLTGFAAAPQAGACRTLYFDGACLLTNGSNFNVQGAANYTTAAGDLVDVYADTTTKFYLFIRKADGNPIKGMGPLLAVVTPTVAANIDFLTTFTSAYDNYLAVGQGITAPSFGDLLCRLATGGAADSGSNYVAMDFIGAATSTTTSTSFPITVSNRDSGAGVTFTIHISNCNDPTNMKSAVVNGIANQSGGATSYSHRGTRVAYTPANTVSGFRLYLSTGGNFAATGKVRVYGYNNS